MQRVAQNAMKQKMEKKHLIQLPSCSTKFIEFLSPATRFDHSQHFRRNGYPQLCFEDKMNFEIQFTENSLGMIKEKTSNQTFYMAARVKTGNPKHRLYSLLNMENEVLMVLKPFCHLLTRSYAIHRVCSKSRTQIPLLKVAEKRTLFGSELVLRSLNSSTHKYSIRSRGYWSDMQFTERGKIVARMSHDLFSFRKNPVYSVTVMPREDVLLYLSLFVCLFNMYQCE
eukprot:TRINITY_DN9185_c0_g1_i3.p1 TRINITY_DN9185_c0_g1~~TRINITY_DN9185_c0_g1_i3.p1  ORF type:complete len:226 (+),score=8.69 TRINITY_DN9185_c0_g1_i3:528-1205(+)